MCKKPDVKCAVVEVAHRSISDILYKYFTCNYSFRYIVFPPKFVRAYNDAEHSTTDMATSPVTDSNVLAIWKRSEAERRIVRVDNVKINVGQHERISKEKMMFAKGAEQNFSTSIFRIAKLLERHPRTIYVLVELNEAPIEGQPYRYELIPVRISKQRVYKILTVLDKRVRCGI